MPAFAPAASAAAVTGPTSASTPGSGASAAGSSARRGRSRSAARSSNPGMTRQAIMGTYVLHEHTFPCQAVLFERRRGSVFLVADVLAPLDRAAVLAGRVDRDVRHEAPGRSAVPVSLPGLEEDAVARADHLDRAALALAEADAFGDPDRLPARMRVPGRPRAGREVDARSADRPALVRHGDRVDEDRARQPVARALRGLQA